MFVRIDAKYSWIQFIANFSTPGSDPKLSHYSRHLIRKVLLQLELINIRLQITIMKFKNSKMMTCIQPWTKGHTNKNNSWKVAFILSMSFPKSPRSTKLIIIFYKIINCQSDDKRIPCKYVVLLLQTHRIYMKITPWGGF